MFDFINDLLRPALGAETEGSRMKIRLPNRHQHEINRHLHHPVLTLLTLNRGPGSLSFADGRE
jgi:hypothetical protein